MQFKDNDSLFLAKDRRLCRDDDMNIILSNKKISQKLSTGYTTIDNINCEQ